jgi:hypothetical protein
MLAPYAALRFHLTSETSEAVSRFGGSPVPPTHDIWITYWQGLGDFDREHGHTFLDQAGLEAVIARGSKVRVSEKSEAIMKDLVMQSIRSDPFWFLRILGRRAVFTASFSKIWPSSEIERKGFEPSVAANEGATDSYWGMTDQADTFRIGARRFEIPGSILPSILLVFATLFAVTRSTAFGIRARRLAGIVFIAIVAALPGPVIATTAGAFEPQCFVIAVFASLAATCQLAAIRFSSDSAAP